MLPLHDYVVFTVRRRASIFYPTFESLSLQFTTLTVHYFRDRLASLTEKNWIFMYFIQHCFICHLSDFTMSEDAGIEPKTVATLALAVRRSNHSLLASSFSFDWTPKSLYFEKGIYSLFYLTSCIPTLNMESTHCSQSLSSLAAAFPFVSYYRLRGVCTCISHAYLLT